MKTQLITFIALSLLLVSCSKEGQFGAVVEQQGGSLVNPGIEGPTIVVVEDPGTSSDPPGGGGGTGGGGNPPGPGVKSQSDVFTQTATQTSKVDILWNIDNSGSMADEQQDLAANFDLFINDFLMKNIDFKMAITTTDARNSQAGNIIGNSHLYLTAAAAANDENQFIDDFQTLINVGTNGSGNEQGLYTTRAFYQKNGASFVRQDALQVVVIVSDEDDNRTAESVQQLVDGIKLASSNSVKIYTIVDTDSNGFVNGQPRQGDRYMAASNLTSGSIADIESNFAAVLTDIGESIVNLTESFALSAIPADVNSIKVYVNGALKPASSYVYNSQSNSIKFVDGQVPSDGQQIQIVYDVPAT